LGWPTELISQEDKNHARQASPETWIKHKSILYRFAERSKEQILHANGIIGFDLDGTLIKTKSGKKFANDSDYVNDWMLWDPRVTSVLRQKHDEGHIIAVISNQNGLEKGHLSIEQLQAKMDGVLQALRGSASDPIPIDFICSSSTQDIFRKPRTGMWEFLLARYESIFEESDR
jgi:bifunctional polynucleotide phosphatase/kinase